ncbi:hypothetical protein ACFQZW_12840 [Lutibacter aestuarii]|uniref:Uncharacterized protein n=1 Tax=Lutibacter aestuarii TaxID=861111 RepID=A0ABW2ZCB2_9FLAO
MKSIYQKETRNAFEDFKHNLLNSHFDELNEAVINDCIKILKEEISQKIIKNLMKENIEIDYQLIKQYQDLAVEIALNFVKKHKKTTP